MAVDQITAIEDAIIARLKTLSLHAAVLPFPDKDFESYEPLHGNGEILVAYAGEDAGPPQTTDLIVQDREMTIELTFVFSSLRTIGAMGGLYAHLELVRQSLTGYRPADCNKKTLLGSVERVRRYKKRWWQFVQRFQATALNIELLEEDHSPLLQRITVHNNTVGETTEVPVGA